MLINKFKIRWILNRLKYVAVILGAFFIASCEKGLSQRMDSRVTGQQENEKGGNILFGFLMTGILITLITLISYVAIFGVII